MGNRLGTRGGRERLIASAFLAPAILALLLLRLLPAVYALIDSFFAKGEFVALDNYLYLFSNENTVNAILTTLWFNLIINPVQILFSFILALILARNIPGQKIWRMIIFIPIAIPLGVSSIVWSVAFRPDDGLINSILSLFSLAPQPWLTSPDQALYAIMILASWVGVGYWMIFLIVGLKNIPGTLYEAASLDGANYFKSLLFITIPLMRRQLLFVLVADTVANFMLFPPVQILTQGGPKGSTNLFMYDIYTNAFKYGDYGLAYAEMTVLVLLLLLIVSIQFRLLKSSREQ